MNLAGNKAQYSWYYEEKYIHRITESLNAIILCLKKFQKNLIDYKN